MTPGDKPPTFASGAALSERTETMTVVDEALASFQPPAGWRVLRDRGRLEARWTGPDDRWARFSVRFDAVPGDDPPEVPLMERRLDGGRLTVTCDCSDLSDETVASVVDLLTPMQRLLARATRR